jgi:ribose transport system substrate-binding protein
LARAKQAVDSLYTGDTFKTPASDSPKAVPGKNVWLISFTLSLAETQHYARAFKAAGKALGWKTTAFDGKFSADQYLNGIRQAITDKADGILLYGVDCAVTQSALKQVRAAGIKVVGSESVDCDDAKKGAPSYFDGATTYTQGDLATWERFIGAAQANYLIDKLNGKVEAIELYETDTNLTQYNHQGFQAEMKKNCPACKIDTVEITGADFGPALQQKVAQALLRFPNANAMEASYDGIFLAGPAAALRASGRNDKVMSVAGVGEAPAINLSHANGGLDAGYGVPLAWEAYDSMDILNRLFAKAKMSNSGIGLGLYDRERNLPAKGQAYDAPIDFAKAYEAAWTGQGK